MQIVMVQIDLILLVQNSINTYETGYTRDPGSNVYGKDAVDAIEAHMRIQLQDLL